MLNERVRILKEAETLDGPIVYWMQRDQRVDDNWALIYIYIYIIAYFKYLFQFCK